MGERLYGDPSLALRELLQNSVDAVRYRQSIEIKEGNPFIPFIKITLKAEELIIEDNGIGMDEYIFGHYFLQIGRSYYNSSECRISGIEVDPVSEFGIGILSVFMVASKFTVESRRNPLDPIHPPDPIYVEIPTAYDYFVRKHSSRKEIGTKITLSLKSNCPFSPSSLLNKLSEIAPFIEYPIVIETNEKNETYKPFLPREKLSHGKKIKEFFEIIFDNRSEGIEGRLQVIGPASKHNIFAQRGFAIPHQKLIPRRLFSNIQASIDLSGNSKLSLSPSRLDLVEDERYKKLISKIQSSILDGFEKYLITSKDSYPSKEHIKNVNELLKYNILSLSGNSIFEESSSGGLSPVGFVYDEEQFKNIMQKLFFNYVPLLIISDNGQRVYKEMKNLNATNLAIVYFNDWSEKIPDAVILRETKRLVGAETILLMHEEEGAEQRDEFLHRILGNSSELYITSIPGLVIEAFSNNRTCENIFYVSNNEFTYKIHNILLDNAPLFVHPPRYIYDFDRVIYNAHHPLFARLLDGKTPKDDASSKAMDILIEKITHCLSHVFDTVYSLSFNKRRGLEDSSNFNYMIIGILKYYPEIYQEFCKVIGEYWKEAKDLGVISQKEDFIGFSLEDLPWFWSYELSNFKYE
jgi:molecular chaperone HtpG